MEKEGWFNNKLVGRYECYREGEMIAFVDWSIWDDFVEHFGPRYIKGEIK